MKRKSDHLSIIFGKYLLLGVEGTDSLKLIFNLSKGLVAFIKFYIILNFLRIFLIE